MFDFIRVSVCFVFVLVLSALLPTLVMASDDGSSMLLSSDSSSASVPVSGPMASPEGYWLVYSKKSSGSKRSLVHLTLDPDHSLAGAFSAIFYVPGQVWDDTCRDCLGQFHDKQLVGMTFLWGLKHSGSSWNDNWSQGRVFNPDSNQTYSASVRLTDQGHSLRFTGCKLVICRSSTWTRVDKTDLPQYIAQSQSDFKDHPFSHSRT